MGKKDNKKKVKKANVKEFPVDSALEQEKKNLNSKRTAYTIYTVFCFVIVFAAAAAAGYFMANNVAALAQRRFMKTESYKMLDIAAKAAIDTSLAYNVLFSKWYYIVALTERRCLSCLLSRAKTAYIILWVSDSLRRRQRF